MSERLTSKWPTPRRGLERATRGTIAAPTSAETTPRRESRRRRAMSKSSSWTGGGETSCMLEAEATLPEGPLFPSSERHDVLLCRQSRRESHHFDVDEAGSHACGHRLPLAHRGVLALLPEQPEHLFSADLRQALQ